MSHTGIRIAQFTGASGGTYPEALNVTIAGSPGIDAADIKGAVVLSTAVLSGLDTLSLPARLSIGFCDENLNHRCLTVMAEDNVAAASADTGYRVDISTVLQITNTGAQSLDHEANVSQFITDGLELSYSGAGPFDSGQAIIFYGDEVRTDTRTVVASASIGGTASISGLDFAPDFIYVTSVNASIVADGSGNEAMMSYGFAARTSDTQTSACVVWEDAQANTSVGTIALSNNVAAQLTSTAGTVALGAKVKVTSWNSDGVTFTTSNAAASLTMAVMCVKFPGTSAYCGCPAISVNAAGNFSITAPQFEPMLLNLALPLAGIEGSVVDIRGSICAGAATATEEGCVSVFDRDNRATSDSSTVASNTRSAHVISTGTLNDWYGSLVSFDTTGFTFAVSNAVAGGTRMFPYMAVSIVHYITTDDTVGITDGAVLMASAVVISPDAVGITDTAVLHGTGSFPFGEDVAITEGCVLVSSAGVANVIVANEAVGITEDCLLIIHTIVCDEGVTITEQVQLVGSAVMVSNDTEGISDAGIARLGALVIADTDTVSITEACVTQRRLLQAGWRGTALATGAVAGITQQAGSERGIARG